MGVALKFLLYIVDMLYLPLPPPANHRSIPSIALLHSGGGLREARLRRDVWRERKRGKENCEARFLHTVRLFFPPPHQNRDAKPQANLIISCASHTRTQEIRGEKPLLDWKAVVPERLGRTQMQ